MATYGIRTRYLGATDTQGARIAVTTSTGRRHVTPYKYELSAWENHIRAAHAFTPSASTALATVEWRDCYTHTYEA
jgi:hypothetical protein